MSEPAFPGSDFPASEPTYGMSLRDWFAGQALLGMIAHPFPFTNATTGEPIPLADHTPAFTARHAYSVADAMLAERDALR